MNSYNIFQIVLTSYLIKLDLVKQGYNLSFVSERVNQGIFIPSHCKIINTLDLPFSQFRLLKISSTSKFESSHSIYDLKSDLSNLFLNNVLLPKQSKIIFDFSFDNFDLGLHNNLTSHIISVSDILSLISIPL